MTFALPEYTLGWTRPRTVREYGLSMIRWWRSLGRSSRRAVVLDGALVAFAVLTAWSVLMSGNATITRHRFALLLVSVGAVLVFLARRRQPLVVAMASFAAWAAASAISPVSTVPMFIGVLVSFALSGYLCPPVQAVVAWLAGAATVGFATATSLPAEAWVGDFSLSLVFCTALWAAGLLVGVQRRRADGAGAALAAERDQRAAAIDAATREEQARIAVDLHDVVSHGLSVVVVQAVAARETTATLGTSPDAIELDRRLTAIESSARDALAEMRRMLGLLQATPDVDPEAVPSLRLVPRLLERARAAGLIVEPIELRVERDLPPGTELAAYRVIQEAVTNVITHAPGSTLRVAATAVGGPLEVVVENTASPRPVGDTRGAGRGLIGMQQRARIGEGAVEAGPTADGGFRVRLTLPAGQR
ncbi:sensor histidine kinase [Microbacterium panaciterrae]|uniref:histidine kinase n=1 Tax=Microbacterium panaciterrae TaxID=985759 RepID=A0ABP8PB17_9MICO